MFHRLQMKWSFCAASVVIAAKPVFHLTCRTFVSPLEISVKFVGSRVLANRTAKRRRIPERPVQGFPEANTFELVADERAFRDCLVDVGLHFLPLDTYRCSKTQKFDTPTRNYFGRTSFELRILPHEAPSGFRSAEGKRSGKGRPTCEPRAGLFEPRPLLWLPQFKFTVNC
jgi:hypothetical protein